MQIINIYIIMMQKSNICLLKYCSEPNLMLQSRIESDLNHRANKNKYIIHKIAKADKKLIANYQKRAKYKHKNLPNIFITSDSMFYHSVYIQSCLQFKIQDFNMLANNKRIGILIALLDAVTFLSKIYGFFYINEKMVGYSQQGNIVLWIHQSLIQNQPKYPINHGTLSQEIFILDFKHVFAAYFNGEREFSKIKTIYQLIDKLNTKRTTFQSLNVSYQSAFWMKNKSQIIPNDMGYRQSCNISDWRSGQFTNMNRFNYGNSHEKGKKSLNTLKKSISFSYLPNQLEKSIITPQHMPHKTLSPSLSLSNLKFNVESHDTLNKSNKSINYFKPLEKSISQKSIVASIMPKVQFTYTNSNIKGDWKKKSQFTANNVVNCRTLSQSQSLVHFTTQTHHQALKISFPHTTTHTFIPFLSNGNISQNFKQSTNFQRKGINFIKYDENQQRKDTKNDISQKSNELQMDLQVLFSDSEQQLHSRQEIQKMEMIMEQFENVLLS